MHVFYFLYDGVDLTPKIVVMKLHSLLLFSISSVMVLT